MSSAFTRVVTRGMAISDVREGTYRYTRTEATIEAKKSSQKRFLVFLSMFR